MLLATNINNRFRVALSIGLIASLTLLAALLNSATAANTNIDRIDFGDGKTTVLKNASVKNGYVEFGNTPSPTAAPTNPTLAPTTPTTHDMGNMPGPVSPAPSSNYQANLARLLASPYRNKNWETSPFINTPSASLPKAQLYGPRSAYGRLNAPPGEGIFRMECAFSHFSYDDPIVYPNQPEAAHLHMYFGNTHANAYSNYNSILNTGGSTCNGGELNRTAYWAPAVIDGNGNVLIPRRALIYYKSFRGAVGKTQVYPDNMQIVADASINTRAGDISSFQCENHYGGGDNQKQDTMPNCLGGTSSDGGQMLFEMNIKFNQCYSGSDPANYKKSLLPALNHWYSGTCPASHPIPLPNLEYRIFYDIKPGDNTSQWFLSSDVDRATGAKTPSRGSSIHADWFGGWNKEVNAMWIKNCNNVANTDCSNGLLGPRDSDPALKKYEPFNNRAPIPGSQILKAHCTSNKTYSKPTDVAFCR